MHRSIVSANRSTGLVRSCSSEIRDDVTRFAQAAPGIERLTARFAGHAYDRHQHETYAIGATTYGVQAFHYRGEHVASCAGDSIVLHPGETHDGHAGDRGGFAYYMLYIEPQLIAQAVQDIASTPRSVLPYLTQAVFNDPVLHRAVIAACEHFSEPLDSLESDALIVTISTALLRYAAHPQPVTAPRNVAREAVEKARALLTAEFRRHVTSEELADVSGLDRFALARHFHAVTGVSPHRYHLALRLREARALVSNGMTLADAAIAAGFSDQSHFTRHFRSFYGAPPGRLLKSAP